MSSNTYCISGFVCVPCEYVTRCCPWQENVVKMLLLGVKFSPLRVAQTASSLKQRVACCLRFAVEDLSLLSWKCQTLYTLLLHFFAAQEKKWLMWPFSFWMMTSGWKNEYISECQVFLALAWEWNHWQRTKRSIRRLTKVPLKLIKLFTIRTDIDNIQCIMASSADVVVKWEFVWFSIDISLWWTIQCGMLGPLEGPRDYLHRFLDTFSSRLDCFNPSIKFTR